MRPVNATTLARNPLTGPRTRDGAGNNNPGPANALPDLSAEAGVPTD
jgi:hypothetical protein